ncbi:MAG: signal peptidase II [Polyangiaceae bacterium]
MAEDLEAPPSSPDASEGTELPASEQAPSSGVAAGPSTPNPIGDVVPRAEPVLDEEPASKAPLSKAPVSVAQPELMKASYVFLIVVTVVNLVADLWTKHWAKTHFESVRARRVVVVEDFMNFIFAKNRGGAWGLLQDETEALRRPFFLIVSVAAIVFIVSLYRKLQKGQVALKWGLPLVLGGALGNLVDRVRYGYVVDFIDVYMTVDGKVSHWPTFNVADISICVGVALMAIDMFTSRKTTKTTGPASSAPQRLAPVDAPLEVGGDAKKGA